MEDKSQRWAHQLINNSHVGVLVTDKERNILFANDKISSMFGYTKEELEASTTAIIYSSEVSSQEFAQRVLSKVLTGDPISLDFKFQRKDRSPLWLRISGDPITEDNTILWTASDITEMIEEKLHDQELRERLELALLGNNDALWDYNLQTHKIYYSPRWKEILGYSDNELANDPNIWYEHVHPEDLQKVVDGIQAHLDGTVEYVDIKHRLRHKDGHWVWIHTRAKAIFNRDRKAIRLIGTNTDITQQKQLQLNEKHQAMLIEQLHESVNTTDLTGKIISWNKASERIFGYTKEEAIGQHISMLRKTDSVDFNQVLEVLNKENTITRESQLLTKSGKEITIKLTLTYLRDEQGKPTHVIGNAEDITEKKKIEQKLEESNYNLKQYIEAIDKLDIGLFVVDEDYTIRYMNNTMIGWFGDQKGKTCYSSVANLTEPCPYCKLNAVIYDKVKAIYQPTTPDGQSFDIVATSIKNADGTTSKMEVIRNITEQKQIEQKLYHQAHYDSLTGLPNRVLFTDRLEQAIKKAEDNNNKFALLFIDLDHFKEINDSLGHAFGDKILKLVSTKLKKLLKESDTIARLGGDEFVIIYENMEQVQDISHLATDILVTLSEAMEIEKNTLYISSSIGISVFPDDGTTTQNLLKYADSAMYKAKEEGRNNYQYYSASMTELAFERIVMETSLRSALKNEEFVVYYQPQVDGKTNKIIGMEALVRWQHPTMGVVSPAKFIPLAESTGLIIELDRFVMKTAINTLASWYKKGLNPGKLALNLAIKQLQKSDFVAFFEETIQENECIPEHIELEVTEGQIMKNPENAIKTLQKLSDIGIELAIDDFGTGYSSLAYLKRLPIDKLKIDQAFIRNLPSDEEDAAIAQAVIALAKSLNLKIIAEGVETKEQRDFIVESGCENIQGYLYSRPVPAHEFELLLRKGFNL